MSIKATQALGEYKTAAKLASPVSEEEEAIKRLDAILEETRANAFSSCALDDVMQAFSLNNMDSIKELFNPDIPADTMENIMEALINVKKVKEGEN